ncbi:MULTISPECIES: hypothetical protein [unclassified Crossiella]|uniref:hypothetical protein n=1 Tax=unclassified Crossiella TaxID=2620835 RepID=UPI001FFF9ED2|nr:MULTISPECIES: hypothetical protein [unclassified Crossiella]MCK2242582.1 hypothetical protein [Crossiella sp. S99.2]MCK2254388.1 hypothetical protein [Crossiella sp. S99.1]
MTTVLPRIGRRRVLVAGALAVTALPLASACTPEPAPEQADPLEALLSRARTDIALAKATATTHQGLAAQAGAVAGDRQQHAEALRKEIDRVRPARPSTSASGAPTGDPAPPPVVGQQTAALTALREAVAAAEKEAAGLVAGLPTYRAGLVGSVAACCASLREVLA